MYNRNITFINWFLSTQFKKYKNQKFIITLSGLETSLEEFRFYNFWVT